MGRIPRSIVLTFAIAAVVAGVGVIVGMRASSPGASATTTDLVSTSPVYWGAYIDYPSLGTAPWSQEALTTFEAQAGKKVSIVHWGEAWYDDGVAQTFNPQLFQTVRNDGAIPFIDWASWDLSSRLTADQPQFSLSAIISNINAKGTYYTYIKNWATAAAKWGHPFFLRFDWEMNGDWYPWGTALHTNGNTPAEYVTMWRDVHNIFTQVGADNVTWVWSPNELGPDQPRLASLYPGKSYVNWLGMVGYNWGTNPNQHEAHWQTFAQIFGPTYKALVQLQPTKPIMVTETASDEDGGSKANWITTTLTKTLPDDFPRVRALVWFNWNVQGLHWVIDSSAKAEAAFRKGIKSSRYLTNRFANLPDGPIPAP